METTVKELPESRVRVEVDVDPQDVEGSISRTARQLGQDMKLPGFRKGKVPPEMVVQRLGREAVLTQALESSLADWYERAMLESGVNPVGDPKLDLSDLPGEGEPLRFAIEVAVQPAPSSASTRVWRSAVTSPRSRRMPSMRSSIASVRGSRDSTRSIAPRRKGDVALIDYEGKIDGEPFDGGTAKDYLLELGEGRVLPELEKALEGAKAGEGARKATVPFPEDYPAEEVAGKTAEFDVKVSEVREKELPELNDDFASEASEFDTLDELRDHISDQVKQVLDRQIAERFREAALDAAVEKATVELPAPVVQARAEEMWRRVERPLAQRGMDPESYLQIQGRSRDEMIEQARPDAERGPEAGGGPRGGRRGRGDRDHRGGHARGAPDPPGHEDHGHPEPADALAEIRQSGREELLK